MNSPTPLRSPRRAAAAATVLCLFLLAGFVSPPPLGAWGIGPAVMGTWGMGRWNRTITMPMLAGGGVVIDSRIQDKGLVNIRVTLGLGAQWDTLNRRRSVPILYSISGNYWSNEYSTTRKLDLTAIGFSASTIIGFTVLKTDALRLWLGPELWVGTAHRGARDLFAIAWGGGPVVGMNLSISPTLSLCLSLGMRGAAQYRHTTFPFVRYITAESSYTTNIDEGDNNENGWQVGGHLEIAILYRFDEKSLIGAIKQ